MESFEFIESGVIFGLDSGKALRQFRYSTRDFAIHGDAYDLYYDTSIITESLLRPKHYRKIFRR